MEYYWTCGVIYDAGFRLCLMYRKYGWVFVMDVTSSVIFNIYCLPFLQFLPFGTFCVAHVISIPSAMHNDAQ
uniref:Uncharacterized protein n=1 Tax=Anguilla anguilla TaxID=7936 RepID=A0A0E9QKF0_ANGAN